MLHRDYRGMSGLPPDAATQLPDSPQYAMLLLLARHTHKTSRLRSVHQHLRHIAPPDLKIQPSCWLEADVYTGCAVSPSPQTQSCTDGPRVPRVWSKIPPPPRVDVCRDRERVPGTQPLRADRLP